MSKLILPTKGMSPALRTIDLGRELILQFLIYLIVTVYWRAKLEHQ